MKTNNKEIEHLNQILRAIRNVNQLIIREKDPDRILQGVCDDLTATLGYYNVWIVLRDNSGKLLRSAESGLGINFDPIIKRLAQGGLTGCAERALASAGVQVTRDPLTECGDCPLAEQYAGRAALTVRIEHDGTIYGLLSASVPRKLAAEEEEQNLFAEVAGDIAFGLHNITVEENQRQAEKAVQIAREYADSIVSTIREPLVILDKDLRVVSAGRSFYTTFQVTPEETEGQLIFNLGNLQWDVPALRKLMEEVLPEKTTIEDYEVEHNFETVGERTMLLNARKIRREGDEELILLAIEDITVRKQAEEELKAANQQLDARNQQLRAGEQQLRAHEQQLQAANQQLNAGNQQLIASEQQLRAANQQLRATEQELRSVNLALRKRIKELDYFFDLAALVERPGISLEELLQGAAELIPPSWQYPEITGARIVLGERKFKTENFRDTFWKLAADLIVRGKWRGVIEVCYLEERPKHDEGPFLIEERKLIDAIAERLGRSIERRRAEEELKKYSNHLEELVKERTLELRESRESALRSERLEIGRASCRERV